MIPSSILFGRLLAKARLRQLQIILLVADLGSIQKAADAAGLSQPATTHALADLEELLEVKLFDRHARGMRPTAIGRALVPMVRSALGSIRSGAYSVSAMASAGGGLVRIGAVPSAVGGLLARALPAFARAHPHLLVRVHEAGAEQLPAMLAQVQIDLALGREPADVPQHTTFTPLMTDRLVIVASNNHRLVSRQGLALADLAAESWAQPPTDMVSTPAFAELWERAELMPDVCRVDSRSSVLKLALLRENQLLDMMPRSLACPLIDAGVLVELDFEVPGGELAPLGVLAPIGPQGEAVEVFCDFLRAVCGGG